MGHIILHLFIHTSGINVLSHSLCTDIHVHVYRHVHLYIHVYIICACVCACACAYCACVYCKECNVIYVCSLSSLQVNYTLLTGQRGGQLSRPMFNVATTGQIPQSPESRCNGPLC